MIFSVCTLTRAESTEVVEHFNATQPDFEPLIWDAIKFEERIVEKASQVTVWPQDLNGNGMFIAGWRRKKV